MFNGDYEVLLKPGVSKLLNEILDLKPRELNILSSALIDATTRNHHGILNKEMVIENAITDIKRIIGSSNKCSLCTHQDTCKYEETLSSVDRKSEGKVRSHVVKCEHFKDKNNGGN